MPQRAARHVTPARLAGEDLFLPVIVYRALPIHLRCGYITIPLARSP